MERRLQAVDACVKGGTLVKFVLGRRQRHERFFRAELLKGSREATIVWGGGSKRGRLLRVDEKAGSGLQREQRLSEEEVGRCFQVVIEGKALALMAASPREKLQWIEGLTAIVQGKM